MHSYANIDCNYFVVVRSWPPASRYLYLWAVIVDHMHRATGICRYNRRTAADETGLPPVKLVKAETWLVENGHWYIEDDWLWVCKRARRELVTNAGTPNIRMTASARNYLNHAGLPGELRAKFLEMYGKMFSPEDRVSIGYRYPISPRPPVRSVSVSGSESAAQRTPLESKGLEEGGGSSGASCSTPPPPDRAQRIIAAYIAAHAEFTETDPLIEEPADGAAVVKLLNDYPSITEHYFLKVAVTCWRLERPPAWAFGIRSLCTNWKHCEGKAVASLKKGTAKHEELERVARSRLLRAIEDADKEVTAALKLTDCVRATQVRDRAKARRDRLDLPDAWECFRYV